MKNRDIIRRMGVAIFTLSLLCGCSHVERWDATHEREYSLQYKEGGGSVSVTVRPWSNDGKAVLR